MMKGIVGNMRIAFKFFSFLLFPILGVACNDPLDSYTLNKEGRLLFGLEKYQVTTLDGEVAPSQENLPDNLRAKHRLDITKQVYDLIIRNPDPKSESEMKTYEEAVPLANGYTLKMVAIPGGDFTMGSPEGEKGRKEDEGPQRNLSIEPMWVCEIEIPWAVYRSYYTNGEARKDDGTLKEIEPDTPLTSLISQPTPQVEDMFVSGSFSNEDEYPAMNMTNHAANKFCQWLSAQTGHYYRLPTEAEWEYACRAGSTTAYPWGDELAQVADYAWYEDNSDFTYQKVKLKKPNAFGLYDMLGNVAEWTLDQYKPDAYRMPVTTGLNWVEPVTRYPRVFRGGSWKSKLTEIRSSSRQFSSTKELKWMDPQNPKSVWYFTHGQHVGFRVVRPMKTPDLSTMHKLWNTDEWTDKMNNEDWPKQ
ncbi:hercynine oxygenase [Rubritalea halochordaticola]|uniref:Hercynine oxygenase n=1 Tax=Rubritalea halochordaticola TaxID=714537 RepID=A0ABP9UV71_9BACT